MDIFSMAACPMFSRLMRYAPDFKNYHRNNFFHFFGKIRSLHTAFLSLL